VALFAGVFPRLAVLI
jgi:hypothetical protein